MCDKKNYKLLFSKKLLCKIYIYLFIYLFIKINIKKKKTVKQKTLFPKILLMRIRSNAKAKILVHKLVLIFVTIIYLTDFKWPRKSYESV